METDLLIIGSGPGGYKAAAYAAKQGLSVTMAERGPLGGTCLNCGCIPTKSLVFDAARIDSGKDLQKQFAAAMDRKNCIVDNLCSGVELLMKQSGVTMIQGTAKFLDATHVQVGEETVEARDIIIATGSKAKLLPIDGLDSPNILTSDELLSRPTLPRRLCIIGAGVIGMELASVFSAFGVQVTIVEFLKECLPTIDQEIAKRLRKIMEKRGIEFKLNAAVTRIEGDAVIYNDQKKQQEGRVEADTILMSVGRVPNVDGLNLEVTGADISPKGIVVDENMQTSSAHLYAIGDVNGRMMLAHAATFQGYRAVNHILGRQDKIDLNIIPSAVFTTPEAASVGFTEDQCKRQNISCKVYKALWRANGRAQSMEAIDGLLKLVVDDNDVIRGCHAFGADSSMLVQEIAALMNFHATRHDLAQIVHIHPTLSEILLDAAED